MDNFFEIINNKSFHFNHFNCHKIISTVKLRICVHIFFLRIQIKNIPLSKVGKKKNMEQKSNPNQSTK